MIGLVHQKMSTFTHSIVRCLYFGHQRTVFKVFPTIVTALGCVCVYIDFIDVNQDEKKKNLCNILAILSSPADIQ